MSNGVIAPEPPPLKPNTPVTPVDKGKPVALVNVAADGVPKSPAFVTNAPSVPTLVCNAVATPVPKSVIWPVFILVAVGATAVHALPE